MGMILRTNTDTLSISDPDGVSLPFDVTNMAYFNIYGKGNLTANYATGGTAAAVVGSPTLSGEWLSLTGQTNYLTTSVTDSTGVTIIAVAKWAGSTGSNRAPIVSNYNGTIGKTLSFLGTTQLQFSAPYTNNSTSVDSNVSRQFNAAVNTPLLVMGRTGLVTNQMTTRDITGGTNDAYVPSGNTAKNGTQPFYIGGAPSSIGTIALSLGAVIIFNRALSDSDVLAVTTYLRSYYASKGITI
ncbi:hypothetical protein [Klebsiella quasipneumoniae]|uniref:hypothetical protein n=1 Tax=Klebsiella quasipneumoniae TaxID=1463165 RepID=UPI00161DE6A5|nr:hypothetical protein [Klebsiella quasipneumoniae]QNC78799.1 hypothetical protein F3137_09510 [Klebsiella quasipneumoniae]